MKIFYGAEGYKAESVPEEEKNQTLPVLEVKKEGGGVEVQHTFAIHHYFRHLQSSSHGLC